jgi:hypothetical protein
VWVPMSVRDDGVCAVHLEIPLAYLDAVDATSHSFDCLPPRPGDLRGVDNVIWQDGGPAQVAK